MVEHNTLRRAFHLKVIGAVVFAGLILLGGAFPTDRGVIFSLACLLGFGSIFVGFLVSLIYGLKQGVGLDSPWCFDDIRESPFFFMLTFSIELIGTMFSSILMVVGIGGLISAAA